ncbi:hypothetical protein N657DRAFT_133376 [Parathielavia appendiculata]|uniref:Uncharacterized protein n=1 Tax=Parathielavia appendiculata TaxID=2587402 RepID=A0AAN6Z1X8_9PEZI|nr:hypothetical protein N657DRAFT_133376 [Parathielavia appendiculata]
MPRSSSSSLAPSSSRPPRGPRMLFTTGATAFVLPVCWAGAMYPWSDWRILLPLLIRVVVFSCLTTVKVSTQVIVGIGIGSLYCVLVLPIQASAPIVDDTGLVVGLLVSYRLFGTLISLAVGSTVFSSSIWEESIADLGPLPNAMEGFKSGKRPSS